MRQIAAIRPKEALKGTRFTMVYDCIMHYPGLSLGARRTLCCLIRFDGPKGCKPTHEDLVNVSGIGLSQVKEYLKELRARRIIVTRQGGSGRAAIYTFLDHEIFRPSQPENRLPGPTKSDRQLAGKPATTESEDAEQLAGIRPIASRNSTHCQPEFDPLLAGIPATPKKVIEKEERWGEGLFPAAPDGSNESCTMVMKDSPNEKDLSNESSSPVERRTVENHPCRKNKSLPENRPSIAENDRRRQTTRGENGTPTTATSGRLTKKTAQGCDHDPTCLSRREHCCRLIHDETKYHWPSDRAEIERITATAPGLEDFTDDEVMLCVKEKLAREHKWGSRQLKPEFVAQDVPAIRAWLKREGLDARKALEEHVALDAYLDAANDGQGDKQTLG